MSSNAPASLQAKLTRHSLGDPNWQSPNWVKEINGETVDLSEFRPPEEKIVCSFENGYDFPHKDMVTLAQTFNLISLGKAQVATSQFKKILALEGEIPTDKVTNFFASLTT